MFYDIEDRNLSRTILKTRRKILGTSYRLFSTNGILRTTMVQIAGEVKITRRTLYNHFGTREEIAQLLHRLMIEDILSDCDTMYNPGIVSKDRIYKCLAELFNAITSDRAKLNFLVYFDQYAGESPGLFDDETLFADYLMAHTPLIKYLTVLKERGCLVDSGASPELLARVLFEGMIAYMERFNFRENSYSEEGFTFDRGFTILSQLLLSSIKEECG